VLGAVSCKSKIILLVVGYTLAIDLTLSGAPQIKLTFPPKHHLIVKEHI
jgi:hypothetical protein